MFSGYIYQLCWRRTAIIGGLMSIAIFQVTAVESLPTKVLVGHKPTVSDIVIDPAKPSAGASVTVSWKYSDRDNDTEADSWVTWLVAGKEVKEGTEKSFTLPENSTNKSLQVTVKPMSAATAFPSEGDQKSSASVTIGMALCKEGTYGIVNGVSGWKIYCPVNKKPVSLDDAVSQCAAQGEIRGKRGLLPMREHMKDFAKANMDICTKLGWPMRGRCGGADEPSANYYWGRESNEQKQKDHYVDVSTGLSYIVDKSHLHKALFTCWIL